MNWSQLIEGLNDARDEMERKHREDLGSLRAEREEWDRDRDAYAKEVEVLNGDIRTLATDLSECAKQRDQFRAHSELFNKVMLLVATTLRAGTSEQEQSTFVVNPLEEIQELVRRLNEAEERIKEAGQTNLVIELGWLRKAREYCRQQHEEPTDQHAFARWALSTMERMAEKEEEDDGS